jgi:hypothetical protein
MNAEREKVESLEKDVERIRDNIGALVGELNQRRHDAFDLKLQFRRHTRGFVVVVAALAASIAGAIALAISRRHRRRSLTGRLRRLRAALHHMRRTAGRIVAHPDRLGQGPSVTRKVAAAGGAAMASVLGKRLAKRLVSES